MEHDKAATLHDLIARIQRRWGVRALRFLDRARIGERIPILPTSFADLDAALEIGGLPQGRLTEFLGMPTSGMATMALRLLAHTQQHGGLVAYLDMPQTFDPEYAAWCGVDLATLALIRPQRALDALDMVSALLSSGSLALLIIDQLQLLHEQPQGSVLPERALRVWNGALTTSECTLVVLTRLPYSGTLIQHIGMHGSALGQYAALRLHIARECWLEGAPVPIGCQARITVLKHMFAPPGAAAQVPIAFEDFWSIS